MEKKKPAVKKKNIDSVITIPSFKKDYNKLKKLIFVSAKQ